MSFSRFRRHQHQAFSPTSSASLSPTGPMLESPITLQALASRLVPEVSMRRKKKQDRTAAMSSMFPEEKDDDDVPASNVVRVSSAEDKTENAGQTNTEAGQGNGTRTQYYDDIFNSRGPLNSPRTMAIHDSIVVAEIKTNARVKEEELKLVSNLSFRLAQIYQRPETSMIVTIQQDICLHFGNSSLPAYLMKVSAHPYIIAPVTNMRNTILIQKALHEFLDIASNRGVIIYTAVSEENFATNGITTMGEAVRINNEEQNGNGGFFKTMARSVSRRKKTNSSSSAPLSITTLSSWAPAAESHTSESASNKDGQKSSSAASEEAQPLTVRRSRSLRDSVHRRVGDLGPQKETQ